MNRVWSTHNQAKSHRVHWYCVACAAVLVLLFAGAAVPVAAQTNTSIPEEIEWTWEVRPVHPDPKLPNVLLLGDSITRNYFPQVTKNLAGRANVYLMAVSTSVGDPRLTAQIAEFKAMERVSFRVIHFNNGMHGWDYTEAQYQASLPGLVACVRSLLEEGGSLIWGNTTPVQDHAFNGATNPRIDARNAAAQAQMQSSGIPVDDLHALMMKHTDLYEDTVHFGPEGARIMGDQVAAMMRSELPKE